MYVNNRFILTRDYRINKCLRPFLFDLLALFSSFVYYPRIQKPLKSELERPGHVSEKNVKVYLKGFQMNFKVRLITSFAMRLI